MLVLGIDPGERCGYGWVQKATNGVIVPLENGILQGEQEVDEFLDKLHESKWLARSQVPPIMVCEDFIMRPKFDGLWTTLYTAKLIGSFRRQAHILKWPFWLQQPSILPFGCKIMAIPYVKGKHLRDNLSAVAHAGFFAQNGARKAS